MSSPSPFGGALTNDSIHQHHNNNNNSSSSANNLHDQDMFDGGDGQPEMAVANNSDHHHPDYFDDGPGGLTIDDDNVDDSEEDTEEASETEMGSSSSHHRSLDEPIEIKEQMYQDKLASLKKQLEELRSGSHPEYVRRVKKLEQQYSERIRLNEIYREYLISCVERDYILEKNAAVKEYEEKKIDLKENLMTDFEERRKMIENERVTMELAGESIDVKPTITRKLRRRPNEPLPVPEKRRKPTSGQLVLLLDEKEVENDLKLISRGKAVQAARAAHAQNVAAAAAAAAAAASSSSSASNGTSIPNNVPLPSLPSQPSNSYPISNSINSSTNNVPTINNSTELIGISALPTSAVSIQSIQPSSSNNSIAIANNHTPPPTQTQQQQPPQPVTPQPPQPPQPTVVVNSPQQAPAAVAPANPPPPPPAQQLPMQQQPQQQQQQPPKDVTTSLQHPQTQPPQPQPLVETRIEDGKLLYERRWFHRGQPVYVEGKDIPRFPANISAIGSEAIWVKKTSDGQKVRILTNQLSRGKVSIKRRAN